jgi:hypothetical protein
LEIVSRLALFLRINGHLIVEKAVEAEVFESAVFLDILEVFHCGFSQEFTGTPGPDAHGLIMVIGAFDFQKIDRDIPVGGFDGRG